ncbi:MAG: hypothetical protein R3245_07305, partial [Kiloniellales bacterium]|nr:hypothetical protein [Kiloniellales bacterium]
MNALQFADIPSFSAVDSGRSFFEYVLEPSSSTFDRYTVCGFRDSLPEIAEAIVGQARSGARKREAALSL